MKLLTDVESESNSSWQNQCTDQFNTNHKLHTEAEGTAKVADQEQFSEVMDSRVDPTTPLRQKNAERVGDDGLTNRLGAEDVLALGEGLEHTRGQVPILAKERRSRFFLWSVSTTFSEQCSTVSGFARMGIQKPELLLGALIRYMPNHPGKQVTPPGLGVSQISESLRIVHASVR